MWLRSHVMNRLRACLRFGLLLTMGALSAACTSLSGTLGAAISKIAPKPSVVTMRAHYLGVCTEWVLRRTTHGWVLLRSRSIPMDETQCAVAPGSSFMETPGATPETAATAVSVSTGQHVMPFLDTESAISKW